MDNLEYPDLSDSLFRKMAGLLYEKSGITLKEHKKYLVVHRLSQYMNQSKRYRTYEEYFAELLSDKSGEMVTDFINALTTNFSYFFREGIHFTALRKYLSEKQAQEPYIRIWSAACSTGEEPYSIAISCMRSIPNISAADIKILATDISTKVLEIAQKGQYHYSKIRGNVEDGELKTFFQFAKDDNTFIVKPEIKDLIAFRYLNIMDDYPFKKKFDVVFLRNILIYFENKDKEIIINKLFETIKPGGLLIMGLSESMVGIQNPFINLKNSIYIKSA